MLTSVYSTVSFESAAFASLTPYLHIRTLGPIVWEA